jgi:Fibronectin type III domain
MFCSVESDCEEQIGAPSMSIGPLTITDRTNVSITVSWDPPRSTGGVELTSYILERKLLGEQNWIRLDTVEPNTTNYTIQNLSSKHEYFFRVIAENPLGKSEPLETKGPMKLALTASKSKFN